MTLTLGAFSTNYLTAQPFGHEERNTQEGMTARAWEISGLLSSEEWASLNSVYSTWRDARILDEDTRLSLITGTTVSFSGTGFGQSWSGIACWFVSAPSGQQTGGYVNATCRIVDAAQQLEVIKKEIGSSTTEDLPDLGTLNLGGAIITLTKPPETLDDIPGLGTTAFGSDYILGPRVPRNALDVQGYTDASGWASLYSWAGTQLSQTSVSSGSYWPLSAPEATAEHKIVDGVKIVRYNVAIRVGVVR